MPPEELARRGVRRLAIPATAGTVADRVSIADPDERSSERSDARDTVCVAGSIFLAGAVRDGLRRRAILR